MAYASAPQPDNPNARLVAVYVHKTYGGRCFVYDDGTMQSRTSEGKRKKTSATPENLAAGHGQWVKEWSE